MAFNRTEINKEQIINITTTVANASSITPNSDTTSIVYQNNIQVIGNLTINADIGVYQQNGKSLLFKITSTNIQSFIWNTQYKGGNVPLPLQTTGGGHTDYYSFIWCNICNGWQYIGGAGGV